MDNSVKCSREVKNTETSYFLRAYGIDEVVMDIQNSSLSRVVLVCRLVRISENICTQMLSETIFYNTFYYFLYITDRFEIGR